MLFDNQAAVEVAITSNWRPSGASRAGGSFLRSLHEPLGSEREGSLLGPGVRPGAVTWELVPTSRSPAWRHGGGNGGRDQCGQATKGVWGMSRRRQATKGAEDCDNPGGAVKRALRPGSPN